MIEGLFGFAALCALVALAVFLLAVRKARAIKARHLRFAGEPLPQLDLAGERLLDAPRGLLHGTRYADGQRLLSSAYRDACVADVFCTGQALFLQREHSGADGGKTIVIPLAWIDEAVLHRAYAGLAGRELPMLRLRWRRGGEQLETELSLRGGMAQLERLRREIHLRQGRGDLLAQLRNTFEARGPGASRSQP